jgi:hypothetical protein
MLYRAQANQLARSAAPVDRDRRKAAPEVFRVSSQQRLTFAPHDEAWRTRAVESLAALIGRTVGIGEMDRRRRGVRIPPIAALQACHGMP